MEVEGGGEPQSGAGGLSTVKSNVLKLATYVVSDKLPLCTQDIRSYSVLQNLALIHSLNHQPVE